jgi:hypothetical protein
MHVSSFLWRKVETGVAIGNAKTATLRLERYGRDAQRVRLRCHSRDGGQAFDLEAGATPRRATLAA